MRFRDFVEYAKANVEARQRTFTCADDDWPITVIADHAGEQPHAFDAPGWIANVDAAKHWWAQAMGLAARDTHPTKLAFISSTWQVALTEAERVTFKGRPSQHPDRFEAVIVIVADAEIEEGHMARIRRRRYGPPLLGAWEWNGRTEITGAMFDPWREALR